MDRESAMKLQGSLSSGESLLWAGQPKQGILIRGSDGLMIPFSLLWGGFAIFWELGAYATGAPGFFLLFGGMFVLMGLYFIFGRFIADSIKRKATYYGLTNDRILILTEFPSHKLKSLNLRTLSDISLSDRSDGSGTITFGQENPMAAWMGGMSWPGMNQYQPMFEFVKNARSVHDMIRDAQKSSPQ